MDETHHEILAAGLAAHESGDFLVAERKYRKVLEADPTNGDANHALGLLMMALDKSVLSIEFLRIALHARPNRLHLWVDYLRALVGECRLSEAWDALRQARDLAIDSEELDQLEAGILLQMTEHNIHVATGNERQGGSLPS